MACTEAVQNQLLKATITYNLILKFHPVGTFKDTIRNKMFYSLCDLVIEHFGAVILLVKADQHYGSAFALLRPLMETCIRAFWVLYIAKDDQLVSIAKRQQEFPGFESARSSLEYIFQKDNVKPFHIDKEVVKILHGLTHSGLEQIVHRYGADRGIIPEYPERNILELLNQAARFSVMAAWERIQQIEGTPDKPSPKAVQLVNEFIQTVDRP